MDWIKEMKAKKIGKCFCGNEIVKWETSLYTIYECTKCEFRMIKLKNIIEGDKDED